MITWFEAIGIRVEHVCLQVGVYPMLLLQVIQRLSRPPWFFSHILRQCEKVGVQSLLVVLLTAVFTGMVAIPARGSHPLPVPF